MRWHLQLLGELSATGQAPTGERLHVNRWATRKVGALLAFLAYHSERSHLREELVERLWPDAETPELGRQSLRGALNSLRKVLEPPGVLFGSVLIADRHAVRLAAGSVITDVGEFRQAHRVLTVPDRNLGAAGEAVRLYSGPFLPGHYDDWVLAARDHLAERYLEALQLWVRGLRQAGEVPRALDTLRSAIAADPTREELHAELMGLLLSEGDRPGAVRQYHALERILQEADGSRPGPTLAAMIRAAAEAPKADPAGAAPISIEPSTLTQPPEPAKSPDHLPLELRSFYGRSSELAHVQTRLSPGSGCRLVTLTGPGGIGKTRLSLEAARSIQEAYAGAAYFVPLAEITDGALLSDRLRSALGLIPEPGHDPLEQVAQHLGERPALLVLDNLEQVAEPAAAWVAHLLSRLSAVTLLATTRTRLLLPGEEELILGPLSLPANTEALAEVASTPSVQLFVNRARSARPDFQVTPSNAGHVVETVSLLEGIPLALELVAARASVLTPAQMVAELSNRLETVASQRADRPDRHRSLRAALEWSYRLLPPRLRAVFRRLSVFRGGWTLEAVTQIAVADASLSEEDRRAEALDAMTQLRHHSLLHLDTAPAPSGVEPRYRILETVREYADEQLTHEERLPLARSHWEYYLSLAYQIHKGCRTEARWFAIGDAEVDNMRAALAATLAHSPGEGSRLAQGLLPYWNCRGRFQEGIGWVEQFLPTQEASPLQQARLLGTAAMLGMDCGELQRSRSYSQRALALARQIQDVDEQIQALDHLGCIAFRLKEYRAAREHYLASMRLIDPETDARRLAWSFMYVGYCSTVLHEWDAAREQLERCLEVGTRSPDLPRELSARLQLANLALLQERYEESLSRFEACLTDVAQTGMLQQRSVCLLGVANAATETGDLSRARAIYLEALELLEELGMRNNLGDTHYFLARLERIAGNAAEAERYRRKALEIAETLEGGGIALQLLLEFALVMAVSHSETSARLLGLIRSMTQERHGEITARQWRDLAFAQAQVTLRLGDGYAETLFKQGAALTPDQAFKEVRQHFPTP